MRRLGMNDTNGEPEGRNSKRRSDISGRPCSIGAAAVRNASGAVERTPKGAVKLCSGVSL
jgi:hypothetical protein